MLQPDSSMGLPKAVSLACMASAKSLEAGDIKLDMAPKARAPLSIGSCPKA